MSDAPSELKADTKQVKEDPGMFESIGSFPVWLLRIIALITPEFLIKKTPPGDK